MSKKGIALCLTVFAICICIDIASYAEEKSPNRIVSERLIAQIDVSSWIEKSFIVSPDSKRVAYMAGVGNKRFVVVDGKKERQYGVIVNVGGGSVIFNSPNSLHYLASKGGSIYLVEERIE